MSKSFLLLSLAIILIFITALYVLLQSDVDTAPTIEVVPAMEETEEFDFGSQQSVTPLAIQNSFTQFLTAETESPSTWRTLSVAGERVPLQDFLDAVEAEVASGILSLIDQREWMLNRCQLSQSDADRFIVLSLRFALQSNYPGDLYQDQIQNLRIWEQSLVEDTLPILFPSEYYGVKPKRITQFIDNQQYSYVNLRTAEVAFPNNQQMTIGYVFIGDELLVSNNIECLINAQEYLFDMTS